MSRPDLTIPEVDPGKYPFGRALLEAYRNSFDDEVVEPLVLTDPAGLHPGRIKAGDSVIFYNIRGEREIQLTRSLTEPSFGHFPVAGNLDLDFTTMIGYDPGLDVRVAFPPEEEISNTMGEVLSRAGLKQVKIGETEKEVHISYFLSGKRKKAFPGESRRFVPSPAVKNYADHPEMSAPGVAEAVMEVLGDDQVSFVLANFANADVVGHIEDRQAILKAVAAVDRELGKVITSARRQGWSTLITADHGTVEKWYYPDGAIDTGHTDSRVPLVLVPAEGEEAIPLRPRGDLTDVAPTALSLLGLPTPREMTGKPLLDGRPSRNSRRLLMIILDGWGLGDTPGQDLIQAADTPTWDSLINTLPLAGLDASGEAVGLPPGTVGNSESGHLHLGAGRRVYSDRVRIDRALEDGSFFENEAFLGSMKAARQKKKALHLMGIVSFYSSHGSLPHLLALMDMAGREGMPEVYIHSFLGRRGERPESGAAYMAGLESYAETHGLGRVVSCIGRYWALDREENWDRVEKTYRLLVHGQGQPVQTK